MTAVSETAKKAWTEAALQALPDDGYLHEVVNGELVMSPKNNLQHENICAKLLVALRTYASAHRLGVVLGSSAGFWMSSQNCRAPDISFIPKERLLSQGFTPSTPKFFPGAPDLAVEVLSPSLATHARRSMSVFEIFSPVAHKSPGSSIRRPSAWRFVTH